MCFYIIINFFHLLVHSFSTAGSYLLDIKTEKKLTDTLNSRHISNILYRQWILLSFNKILYDFRKLHNGSNTTIKHIFIPPLLKIIMIKLIHSLRKNKLEISIEEDYELMSTINAISCFFQKLYEVQIEVIGIMDLIVIEKVMTETCLNEFEEKKIIECFLNNIEQKNTKLDTTECCTIFLNSILKINFMWHKMQNFVSLNLDFSQNFLNALWRSKEKKPENIIFNSVTCLV